MDQVVDFFATVAAIIFFSIIVFGPIVLVILILRKIYKRNKKKTNTQNNQVAPIINNNNFKNDFFDYDCEKIFFEEDKEEIDEYYDSQYIPYRPKFLLTKNEWNFYKSLKEIADEKHLTILSKIRVADLVEVEPMSKNNWKIYFNKISRKHVDFALARPENLKILLLIELDDYSHNDKQYERDRFIEAVYKKTGYKLLRVKNTVDLKEKIEQTLKQ